MKARRLLMVMAIVFGLGVFASCDKTTAQEDELYELSLEKDEIKEEDT